MCLILPTIVALASPNSGTFGAGQSLQVGVVRTSLMPHRLSSGAGSCAVGGSCVEIVVEGPLAKRCSPVILHFFFFALMYSGRWFCCWRAMHTSLGCLRLPTIARLSTSVPCSVVPLSSKSGISSGSRNTVKKTDVRNIYAFECKGQRISRHVHCCYGAFRLLGLWRAGGGQPCCRFERVSIVLS